MIYQLRKNTVTITKDDETLHAYLKKGYTIDASLCCCLTKLGLYYNVGEVDIIELKHCYHVRTYN